MGYRDWSMRVVDALHRLAKRQHGALTRAERATDVAPGYVRRRADAGTIDLRKLFGIVESVGGTPERFFRQVFPANPNDVSLYLDPPKGRPPAILDHARRRLASPRPASILRSYIAELDLQRYERPMRTLTKLSEAIEHLAPGDIPFTLGVWASSQRLLLELDAGLHALALGLEIAAARDDHASFGDLLRRLTYIVADASGNYHEALALTRDAMERFVLAGDIDSVGRTLVDRGAWLYYLGRYHDAIAAQERALSLIPESDQRHRFGALQGLGLYYKALGDLTTAEKYSQQALTEGTDLGVLLRGKQLWLQASIHFERGELDRAEALLEDVVVLHQHVHHGDAALAVIDLAEVQLKAGKPTAAYDSAHSVLPFLAPIGGRSRIVRSAEIILADLAGRGASGMQRQSVDALRQLINKAQHERHLWRSLILS